MKKITSILLILVMVLCIFTGCGDSTDKEVMVEGAIFGGKADDAIETEVQFYMELLTKGDNKAFNSKLATSCALLCADSYFREKDVEKGSANRVVFAPNLADKEAADAAYEATALLKAYGFTETEHIETYKAKEYSADTNDSATLNLGYCKYGKTDVFAVVLRGCFSAGEWESAFDPGAEDQAYAGLTGEHAEWQNTDTLKGYDISLNRAKEFIDSFIGKYDDPDVPNIILITGHSRGGSQANVLGAMYEKEGSAKTFTYTFNAMAVTAAADAAEYKTIFNVFDSNDFYVDLMPFANEKFARYGKDITKDISDAISIKKEIANLKNRDDYTCTSKDVLAKYASLFGEMFPDRNAAYEMKSLSYSFDAAEEAEAKAETLKSLISADAGLNLEVFCNVSDAAQGADGKYTVTYEYCGGAVLRTFSKILAYGEAAYQGALALFDGDEAACEIFTLLFDNMQDFSAGHLLVNGYVLAQKYKAAED